MIDPLADLFFPGTATRPNELIRLFAFREGFRAALLFSIFIGAVITALVTLQ